MAVETAQREVAPFWWEAATPSPGVAAVSVHGELDLATVPLLERALAGAEERCDRTIVVDLRGLEFIDLAGARCIVAADARARDAGVAFHVVAGARAARLFALANLDGLSVLDG